MPNFINRPEQNVIEELQEFSNTGPFGGIQSEIPLDQVEQFGQVDVLNMALRKSVAETRSGYTTLPAYPAPANEDTTGIADFYTSAATRIQVVMTLTRLIEWNSGTQNWTNIPPGSGALTGGPFDLFTWTVVNDILCFCQGIDNLKGWDGIAGTFTNLSASAFPAKYLMELATHLVTAYTVEAGTPHTQRVRWSGSGDPTDWTSPSSGLNDILGDLGPITGCVKIFQTGYIFHQWGVTQMIPTGVGTNPFQFVPLTTRARGNTVPYSLAAAGEEFACYIGKDNIYKFNGTNSEPIGDRPVEGVKRAGARSRIFADLAQTDPRSVVGYVSDTINGQVFPAYWIMMPQGANTVIWIYNLDEQNWARFTFTGTMSTLGRFFQDMFTRWLDLVGTWAAQTLDWDQFAGINPFDTVLLAFNNGVDGNFDFNSVSEQNFAMSGVFLMGDVRHSKTIQKFRVTIQDNGPVTFTVALSNAAGLAISQTITMGSGTGRNISQVFTLKINGIRINYSISGVAGQDLTLVEFAPLYSTGGEQRGGTVDS